MESLTISVYPDAVLREKCAPAGRVTGDEEGLFERMLFTMRASSGIGLAAPQVGVSRRLIVADIGEGAVMLADPVILKSSGSARMEEGCLSIPGVSVVVDRPDDIIVSGLNEKGKVVEFRARGLMARVLQHEIDHLKGRLIIDYMHRLDKVYK